MSGINDRQAVDALLEAAGEQLHQDPQRLRAQLEGGQLQEVLDALPAKSSAQITRLMQDPQQLEKLMSSPQVKNLLDALGRR